MNRTSILNDPSIGEDAKKMGDERFANIVKCQCVLPDDSNVLDSSKCEIHREPPHHDAADLYCGLAPLQQQRASWNGSRTVIRHAQSPEAAFLQRLHLRIETARPRSFWAPE